MSYSENDFPVIIKRLQKTFEEAPESLREAMTREMLHMLKTAPLYPGLIAMMMDHVAKAKSISEVQIGDEVILVEPDGQEVWGKVQGVESGRLQLTDVRIRSRRTDYETSAPPSLLCIDRGVLEASWPTLVFETEYPSSEVL
jgi:hypothetical protein